MDPGSAINALTSVAERALAATFLVVMMFSMGLALGGEPRKAKAAKRHERRLLARALVVNLVVIPLVAFALVRGLHRSGMVASAVLIVAATPGGRFAPHLAKIARGELGLAVEITLFLAKLTAFTAPVTIKWLLGVPRVELSDLVLIAEFVALQFAPYLAGRWLRRARPGFAARLVRPLLYVEAAVGATFLLYLIGRGELAEVRALGVADFGVGVAFAVVSLAVGWLAGGSSPETRRSFAVTTMARNLALGLLAAGEVFPGGAVQLALFGIWFACFVASALFALAARALRPAQVPRPA